MDCSLPGSSAHGICQARVLEWGAIAFSGCISPGIPEEHTYREMVAQENVELYLGKKKTDYKTFNMV